MRGDMTSIQGKLEVMETKQVTKPKKKEENKKEEKNLSATDSVKKVLLLLCRQKKVNVNPTIDTQEESHQANMGTHER